MSMFEVLMLLESFSAYNVVNSDLILNVIHKTLLERERERERERQRYEYQ